MVEVKDKRDFLTRFMTHANFSRREILWLLNYLIGHEVILEHVHIVEHSEKTPRGLRFISAEFDQVEPITMFRDGRSYLDVDQIFHDIRLNWKEELFLETGFPDSYYDAQYRDVLEDNPYYRWSEHIDEQVEEEIDEFLHEQEEETKLKAYYQAIDLALAQGNEAEFIKLSEQVKAIKNNHVDSH
jgi:uncharacterized protein YpiB (UPF0302 family)